MEWREQGAVLSVRQLGETSTIVEVFTAAHGRHAGVVRGGISRRIAPHLQPGGQVEVTWRARLDEHIGTFTVEPVRSRAAQVMGDRLALAGLNAVTALLGFALPERDPHPDLYAATVALLDALGDAGWPGAYLLWERGLLEELGFGLDLGSCAVTGATEGLEFVSPRTGRAVSRAGAGDWADRLLPLPACLVSGASEPLDEVLEGLRTTGHFLALHAGHDTGERPLPAARQRLIDLLARPGI
jgi:DNA repair protein RecO (recombination protein O)